MRTLILLPLLILCVACTTSTSQSTEPKCAETEGRIEKIELEDPNAKWWSPIVDVYLPPCYDESAASYPVFYLLQGYGMGLPYSWSSTGAYETMDALIADGAITPFILAAPTLRQFDDRTEVDAWVMEAVIPAVSDQYRTLDGRDNRGLAGMSAAGASALRIAYSHPEQFGQIGVYSGAFGLQIDQIEGWLDGTDVHPHILLDIGDEDDLLIHEWEMLQTMVADRNIPYTATMGSGRHSTQYWRTVIGDYFIWHNQHWGINQ